MGVLTVELLQKQGNQNEVTIPAAVHMLPSLIYATEGKGKKKKGPEQNSKTLPNPRIWCTDVGTMIFFAP